MPSSSKHCVICGKDCTGHSRIKDAQGRYYHIKCIELEQDRKTQKSQQGVVEPESLEETGIELDTTSLMDEITYDAMHGEKSQNTCASCGLPMSASHVICINCGYDSQSGFALEGDVDFEKPQHARISFLDKASVTLTTNFVVGMAIAVCIIAILLIIFTITM